MATGKIFKGKTYLLITGASRGIGRAITKAFALRLSSHSHVLILARNSEALESLANELPNHLHKFYPSVNLSEATEKHLSETIQQSLRNENSEHFDQAIIVHNVGTIGTTSQLTNEMIDFDYWHNFYKLNFFSSVVINGLFMKTFDNAKTKKYVINIASLWATKPDPYVGDYCSVKAAKEMFFQVFTVENPEVRVLHYFPGIVKTDMVDDIIKNCRNKEIVEKLRNVIKSNDFVTPEDTADNLVNNVFANQNYESGEKVDYHKCLD